jgi:alpha-L-fucosidase 2
MNIRTFLMGCLVVFSVRSMASQEHKLWYNRPASTWTEALPLGNGRLGAMLFGNPSSEHIQLNEATIWAGRPNENANPEALKYLPKIRRLIFEGKYLEAQTMATEHVMSNTNSGMPYQPFGDLYINFPSHAQYINYYRELSLDSACAVVTYKVNKVEYRREVITSFPDQVVIMQITASKPGSITCNAMLTSPHQDVTIQSENKEITLSGLSSWHEGLKGKVEFEGRVAAKLKGGSISSRDGVLSISNADEVIFYISIATNFNNYKDLSGDASKDSEDYLVSAMKHNYEQAKLRHVAMFQHYMNRANFELGPDCYSLLPTDERILHFKENNDLYLVSTYFCFGRYLLISCSRPGGQAANLQGIWNDKMFPSWDSKYTCNINLEMNYWPSEVTNLTELNGPLFRLIHEVSETGKKTAKVMYGANGWVLHHNTDIWRITGPIDKASSGMWSTGAAWLCHHLWEHYLYTGDTQFLRKVYPTMREAARFFNETLVKEPTHGWLVVCPSLSPENTHAGSHGKATIAAGVTLDNSLVRDLFQSVITSSRMFGFDKTFTDSLSQKLLYLPPMQIGRWGQLQEWMDDWDDPADTHRHVSHLYSLFPGAHISPYRTPELFDAARTSLIHRGDESTGWSMGWKICLWARLLDGDHACKLIGDQLTLVKDDKKVGGTYSNMFDAHPPFQIDGNFGCVAGIAEMLMQSYDSYIYLLPALPLKWKEGEITGLCARGGFELSIRWKEGKLQKVTVLSRLGGNCRIRSLVPLKGKGLRSAHGENTNPLYRIPVDAKPIIHDPKQLSNVVLRKTYVYDLNTKAGKFYTLMK